MKHYSQEELIACQLHESPDEAAIRAHLEHCSDCAELAESIAETLRVFSAEPVPERNLDHNWQRLRGSLPQLATAKPERSWRGWRSRMISPLLAVALAGLAVAVGITFYERHAAQPGITAIERPRPFSEEPRDPAIAQQLDSAERLLTEVNHTSGPLDAASREQAHELRLKNAFYIDRARSQGDNGTASVLEDLDHVLTNIDHDVKPKESGMEFRVQWNTKGLLLDIRVLRQNDARE